MSATAKKFLFLVFMLGFLALTNRWFGWEEGIRYLQSTDVYRYSEIAAAAPELPHPATPDAAMGAHHAERFFVHYLAGTLAHVTGLGYPGLERAGAYCGLLAVVGLLGLVLSELGLGLWGFSACAGVFVLNPYALRFYVIVPGGLADVLFLLGLATALLGLVRDRWKLVTLGAALAILGRQTGLMLLPGLAAWYLLPGEGKRFRARVVPFVAITVVTLAGYLVTRVVGSWFSARSLYSTFFIWADASRMTPAVLAEHVLRILVPHLVVIGAAAAVLARLSPAGRRSREAFCLFLIGAAVLSQPLLFSPFVVVQNQGRLSVLGLLAFTVALGYLWRALERERGGGIERPRAMLAFLVVLALHSLHHLYTVIGPPSAVTFAVGQLLAAAAGGAILWYGIGGKSHA